MPTCNESQTTAINSIHVYLYSFFSQYTSFQSSFTEKACVHITVYSDLLSEETVCLMKGHLFACLVLCWSERVGLHLSQRRGL